MTKKKIGNIKFNPSKIPLESSLGHLAFGDLAFTEWRKLKIDTRQKKKDEEE